MHTRNWAFLLYRFMWRGLDLVFPPVCGGCGQVGKRWCETCAANVILLDDKLCDVCGMPVTEPGMCAECRIKRPRFQQLRSWAAFEGPVRDALHKLKYRRDVTFGLTLAEQVSSFVASQNWPVDMVIPIPLGRQRYRERGYNQVGMIAKPLAMGLNIRYEPKGLARQKETRSQVGLTRPERSANMQAAFRADKRVSGRTVLVIDDVATTGSTLSSAAEALFAAGACGVYAMTIARALLTQHT